MRRLSAVSGVLLLVLGAAACGQTQQAPGTGETLCSPAYEPRELVDHGPLYSGFPSTRPTESGRQPDGPSITDAAAIRKIAAAACALPTPPQDVACTLELGPSFELRFVDTRGRTTTLTAESYGCQFVEGLSSRRFKPKPLWEALSAAGLPAPSPR